MANYILVLMLDAELYIIFILLCLMAGVIFFQIFMKSRVIKKTAAPAVPKPTAAVDKNLSVMETLDYKGTKILNDNGVYTVVENGFNKKYSSIAVLPLPYRKMLAELNGEAGNLAGHHHILENINGKYYVTFPDGKKKQYKRYHDIPGNIRRQFTSGAGG